jgi:hypothetical protein
MARSSADSWTPGHALADCQRGIGRQLGDIRRAPDSSSGARELSTRFETGHI